MKNIIVIFLIACSGCLTIRPIPVDDFASAQRHHELGNFEEAARIYGVLIEQGITRKNHVNILYAKGICHMERTEWVKAYSCFLHVEIDSRSSQAEKQEAAKHIKTIEFVLISHIEEKIINPITTGEEDMYAIAY